MLTRAGGLGWRGLSCRPCRSLVLPRHATRSMSCGMLNSVSSVSSNQRIHFQRNSLVCRRLLCSKTVDEPEVGQALQLGQTAQFLVDELSGCDDKGRLDLLEVVERSPITVAEKAIVATEILKEMANHYSLPVVHALRRRVPALAVLRDHARHELNTFSEMGLRKLHMRSRPELYDVMVLYTIVSMPTKDATDMVVSMMGRLVRQVKDLPSDQHVTREMMRFLTALNLNAVNQGRMAEDPAALVVAMLRKIGDGLPSLPLPTPNEIEMESKFAPAVIAFGVRDTAMLEKLVQYLHRCADARQFTSIIQIARLLHCLSMMRVSAPELFMKIGKLYHGHDCNFEVRCGLYEMAFFSWAFLAQGMQPPQRGLDWLGDLLQRYVRKQDKVPKRCLTELLQLMPHLQAGHAGVSGMLGEAAIKAYHEARKLGHILAAENATLLTKQGTDYGLITAAGLLDHDTLEFRSWPCDLPASAVRAQHAQQMHGQPVALVVLSQSNHFLQPDGVLSGIMERQRRLMTLNGWTVVMMPLKMVTERKLAGDNYAKWCIAKMKEAGKRDIQRRQEKKE